MPCRRSFTPGQESPVTCPQSNAPSWSLAPLVKAHTKLPILAAYPYLATGYRNELQELQKNLYSINWCITVIQCHRNWYQSKSRTRLNISLPLYVWLSWQLSSVSWVVFLKHRRRAADMATEFSELSCLYQAQKTCSGHDNWVQWVELFFSSTEDVQRTWRLSSLVFLQRVSKQLDHYD